MGIIATALIGPIVSVLSAIAGPLLAFLAGRSAGRAAAVAESTERTSEALRRQAAAVAAAPHTKSETVTLLRDSAKEF